ncbi:XK-related protein 9 [Denticeps clupeoides]|uniref:XK-related protein n=1 Tax=Denticeps clupeoides TaxID=299321 RepID=A0AAY4AJS0_9TELE|nr:XK-related protein 9 [Denticeps clupeoides]
MNSGGGFSKLRWICTVLALLLYVVDYGADVFLAGKYFRDGHAVWCSLTLLFVLLSSMCTQIFSYAWFCDDVSMEDAQEETGFSSIPHAPLAGFHFLQMGIFTRYFQLLRKGAKVLWSRCSHEVSEEVHLGLFALATDLSMLRLFEAFLESIPQLLLQLYILLMDQGHCSVLQYISMVGSFCNVAWATVDYRRCFRRSLPHIREMPSGLPTAVYLAYKLLTTGARILGLSLFIVLTPFNLLGLAFMWLLGTLWAHVLETDFCTSTSLEKLYRVTVGFILIFTFFNVKGQKTAVSMAVYYIVYALQTLSAPVLLFFFKPEVKTLEYFLPVALVILTGLALGLGFLSLYYSLLHPRYDQHQGDEVDGAQRMDRDPERKLRVNRFLQI